MLRSRQLARRAVPLAAVLAAVAGTVPAAAQARPGTAAPPPAPALQVRVAGGLGLASAYLYRGVALTNLPVLQPELNVGLPVGGGEIAFGFWGNLEIATYSDTSYFSMAPGKGAPRFTEFRPSLELTQKAGRVRYGAGGLYRLFFADSLGITSDANTAEVFARVGLEAVPLNPGLRVVYGIGTIAGLYLEGTVRQPARLGPGLALVLSGTAGLSVDQEAQDAPAEFDPYTRTGFTHADLTAALEATVAGVKVTPWFTYTWTRNPPARQEDGTAWFGVSIGGAGTFPKPPAAAPAPAPRR